MSEPRVLAYVDEQLAGIRRAPLMWGSPICIELQYLQLLETWMVALRPDLDEASPRYVKERYAEFRRRRHPELGPRYLSALFGNDVESAARLVAELDAFDVELKSLVGEANPFESYDLALALVLKAGVVRPSSTTLTSYLEVLRRILRGTLRDPAKRGGRAGRDIEALTEFEIPEVDIRAANGAPARVLFPLAQRRPAQLAIDGEPERAVRGVVGHLVAIVEWAASQAEVSELRGVIADPERRQRVAREAMRLVPRGQVDEVQIGGNLVSRYAPVRLRTSAKGRLVEVMTEGQTTEDFDCEGEIRGLDLDQASIRLRSDDKETHLCWLNDDPLESLSEWELGARVRVVGKRVHGVLRRPVVLADEITLVGEAMREKENT